MTSKPEVVHWTPAKRARLLSAYEHAVAHNEPQFAFEGNEFVTSYAKYLLEYLNDQFNRQP